MGPTYLAVGKDGTVVTLNKLVAHLSPDLVENLKMERKIIFFK